MKRIVLCVLCVLCAWSPKAGADPISETQYRALESKIQELSQTVVDLKRIVDGQRAEIQLLKNDKETRSVDSSQKVPAIPTIFSQGSRDIRGKWNPDIGVVGDVVFQSDSPKADEEGADRIAVRELEIVFGSAVDPYSRFDATLGIADFEEMSVEEAYLTRYGLPFDFTARLGRFLPKIGKSIPYHRDSLDTVDEPMVIEKYFGHHGYNKTGLDLTRAIDLPWAATHQWTFGVLEGGNGEEGTLFGQTRRHPTIYNSLKNYLDIGESAGLELGASHLVGSRDDDESFEVNVIGLDATLIHRYADQRHWKLQSEAYRVSRTESFYVLENEDEGTWTDQDLDDARHLWGGYLLADWRFLPQWAAGLRWDNVQLIESGDDFAGANSTQNGITGYLTFYQSEFARWRVQYSHIDQTDGKEDNRVFIQGTFAIGEHKHKIS